MRRTIWRLKKSRPRREALCDEAILRYAVGDNRVLLTEDKDFGELVVRLGLPAFGVVLMRMNPADSAAKLVRLREVLQQHAALHWQAILMRTGPNQG